MTECITQASAVLRSQGWVTLGPESRDIPMLTLASSFGHPIPSPTGELIRKLVPKERSEAIPGTLSGKYGKAALPMHTDTAFWPQPARYLVMRVTGDTRRPTILASINPELTSDFGPDVATSVWLIRGGGAIYGSMQFSAAGEKGIRCDLETMSPANRSAATIHSRLREWLVELPRSEINWKTVGTLVIDNWKMLHGRGPEPEREGNRVLERIYLR